MFKYDIMLNIMLKNKQTKIEQTNILICYNY